jgi:hypothetical protein
MINLVYSLSSVAQLSKPDLDGLVVEVSTRRSYTIRHTHTRQDSSEVVISPSPRPLPTQYTTNTRDEHSYPQRDPNPKSQQWSGLRPTPQIARPSGSAHVASHDVLLWIWYSQITVEGDARQLEVNKNVVKKYLIKVIVYVVINEKFLYVRIPANLFSFSFPLLIFCLSLFVFVLVSPSLNHSLQRVRMSTTSLKTLICLDHC